MTMPEGLWGGRGGWRQLGVLTLLGPAAGAHAGGVQWCLDAAQWTSVEGSIMGRRRRRKADRTLLEVHGRTRHTLQHFCTIGQTDALRGLE